MSNSKWIPAVGDRVKWYERGSGRFGFGGRDCKGTITKISEAGTVTVQPDVSGKPVHHRKSKYGGWGSLCLQTAEYWNKHGEMVVVLPAWLVKAIDDYNTTPWHLQASNLGALNAVAFIGEQVAALVKADKK